MSSPGLRALNGASANSHNSDIENRPTHPHSVWPPKFLLESIREGARDAGFIRVEEAHGAAKAQEGGDEAAKMEESLARRDVSVLLRTEDAQDIVILVDRLAKVAPLLLVPPFTVGVAECTLDARRVRVVAVLETRSIGNTERDSCQERQYHVWVIDLCLRQRPHLRE